MLSELTSPLTMAQARHLLRRACWTVDPDRVANVVGRRAREVVEGWVSEPFTSSLLPGPYWVDRLYPPHSATSKEIESFFADNDRYCREVRILWLNDLLSGTLRARMTMFWHSHFVTELDKYQFGALAYRYAIKLAMGALGDFKDLTMGFVTDGAMLLYLDGNVNQRKAPNENFARELLELFTMGLVDPSGNPNYTQKDIVEAARAFTGWGIYPRESWEAQIAYYYHDRGEKIIFGQNGAFDHKDVIELIFSQRSPQVAFFLAGKLLKELLNHDPHTDLVSAVAERIMDHDFVIGPVLVDILSSEVFFDSNFRGGRITSPLEYLLLTISALCGRPPENIDFREELLQAATDLGQNLLSPPNVAGWPGHRAWLATDTLPSRWNQAEGGLFEGAGGVDFELVAERFLEHGATHPALSFPVRLAEAVFAVPLEFIDVPQIGQSFSGDLYQNPLPAGFLDSPDYERNLVKLFLGSTPWYEWAPTVNQSLRSKAKTALMVRNYFLKLSQFPEFQLT
ncbi:MAG: DUF1800 domain-containing protein [Rhodothermales bacterium]